jgi:hypothetical protein
LSVNKMDGVASCVLDGPKSSASAALGAVMPRTGRVFVVRGTQYVRARDHQRFGEASAPAAQRL